jgi:hypothetical protein
LLCNNSFSTVAFWFLMARWSSELPVFGSTWFKSCGVYSNSRILSVLSTRTSFSIFYNFYSVNKMESMEALAHNQKYFEAIKLGLQTLNSDVLNPEEHVIDVLLS